MTDSPTPAGPGPVDPDVDLASAHLDGEAGPDERARAENPAVQTHLAAFAGIADQVRDVPPPPAGLLDDHLARAMDAFDEEGTVVAIGRARTSWWQRIPLGAVAAALVVVALVGIASLAGQGGDDKEDTATAALESADEGSEGGDSGDDSAATADAPDEEAALESAAGFGGGDRRAYESYDDLAAGIRDELGSSDATADAPEADGRERTTTSARRGEAEEDAPSTDPCGAVQVLGVDPAAVLLVRPVVVTPDPVTVVVHDAEDGRRLAVVDDATCDVVLDRLL
jgi:hypothetical protein